MEKYFTFSCSFYVKSRGVLPRRTPVVSSFPFFPGKERKLTGEASSPEESERIGIFPDAASSSGLHRLAMLATAFLASEKIPMILSDNGRRGLTLQEKEDAARSKFSCVPGWAEAQPCQCLRGRRRGTLFSQTVLPTQGCETHPSTPPPAAPSGRGNGKFQTGGPPCAGLYGSVEIGNSGLKFIEGRHQPGPRFGARAFVPEVIDEHRVRRLIVVLTIGRLP